MDIISVIDTGCYVYPKDCIDSYRPDIQYPEYPFDEVGKSKNGIYDGVRKALYCLELDKGNYGTSEWNPLGEYIKPGMNVLIKPNLVCDKNHNSEFGTDCLFTQPSVVAPIIDYAYLALGGKGKIIIGDAPVQSCDFKNFLDISGYNDLIKFYKDKNVDIEIVDFRGTKSTVKNGVVYSADIKDVGATLVNLGIDSQFSDFDKNKLKKLRICDYDPNTIGEHHNEEKHEYLVSDYVLNADVIINMPKPKTHRLAGATVSLKNFVGICVKKDYLPHHTLGDCKHGGDEADRAGFFIKVRSWFMDRKNKNQIRGKNKAAEFDFLCIRICSRILSLMGISYRDGAWYGNDTINRTITDINKIVYFADKEGNICDVPCRKVFIIADMIISGENEGPLGPSPKNVGLIVAGANPILFDKTVTSIMGFDYHNIPTIMMAEKSLNKKFEVEGVVVSNNPDYNGCNIELLVDKSNYSFIPASGWKGYIEYND